MKNTLYIISTGPGDIELLTIKAQKIIEQCDVIVGYERYLEDLKPIIENKNTFSNLMTGEIERCNKAIEFALQGKKVAIVSNGDVNVFGLASLVIEIIDQKELWNKLDVISIPGVPSLLDAAAKLGAPISQDFAVVSLSDRLTHINIIEKRIEASLNAGFILIILNPKSRTRTAPYQKLLKQLDKKDYQQYPTIIAENISRPNEKTNLLPVKELIEQGIDNQDINMSSLLIIGNNTSRWTKNNKMLTPRGYLDKYNIKGELKN